MLTIAPDWRADEVAGGFPRHQHRPGDIGGEHALEAGQLHVHERREHAEPGIVDQHVQMPEGGQHFANRPGGIGFFRHVGLNGVRADVPRGRLEARPIAPGDRDLGARARERVGDVLSDTGGTTRDEDDGIGQLHDDLV